MPYKNKIDKVLYRRRYINLKRQIVRDYLGKNPCVRCGYNDIRALEFDHIIPELKKASISTIVIGTYKPEVLLEEIKKCQVLCANCHRIKTLEHKDWMNKTNIAG